MRFDRIVALACGVSALSACDDSDDDDIAGVNQFARVQVINASATGAVTTTSGGNTLGTNLAFGSGATSCVQVPAGTQGLRFNVGTTTNAASTGNFNFQAGQNYTVVVSGNNATVLPYSFTAPSTGNMGVRFVNATNTAGDVFITTPTGTVSGTANASLAAGAATGGTTGTNAFQTTNTANTRVRFFNTGVTTGTPRADLTLSGVGSGQGTTVLFANTGTGGTQAFQVNPCT